MKFQLKSITPKTLAKIYGLFGFIIGATMAVILILLYLIEIVTKIDFLQLIFNYPPGVNRIYIIATLLLVGLFYYIQGGVIALIYNFLSTHIGGIEVTLNKLEIKNLEKVKKSKQKKRKR